MKWRIGIAKELWEAKRIEYVLPICLFDFLLPYELNPDL